MTVSVAVVAFGQAPAAKSFSDQQARTVSPSVGLKRLPGTYAVVATPLASL